MEVEVLYDSRNWTILNVNGIIKGYSYQKCICEYNDNKGGNGISAIGRGEWSKTNEKHFKLFKNYIAENFII